MPKPIWPNVAHLYPPTYLYEDHSNEKGRAGIRRATSGKFIPGWGCYIQTGSNVERHVRHIKPFLRRINTLTKPEIRQLIDFDSNKDQYTIEQWMRYYKEPLALKPYYSVQQFALLLSWHIDLFDLIDSGEAVDAASLDKEVSRG